VKQYVPAILADTVISEALSTGQQNYLKKVTDDGRISFAYNLHNLQHKTKRLLMKSPG